ncbi:hypothetical protein FAIPA1_440019 [Frankia sp. AiPs1]|uniref:NAD(P)H-dependent oxidoreductase n=1 Tax=Frankia sp. AiPa1 TaxID=573492 RepID=UPI00202AE039|nr:NAD(P)H-dependent oxidoreductase [Frankia sp. AiPa1]MCL9760198.1 hypothetical protein [Frankia sp. AiPa1]
MFVSFGFRNKPVACVGYAGGPGGGIRAIEHLAQIFIETEAVPLRSNVVIPMVARAFDAQVQPADPMTNASADVMLDDLAWWPQPWKPHAPPENWFPAFFGAKPPAPPRHEADTRIQLHCGGDAAGLCVPVGGDTPAMRPTSAARAPTSACRAARGPWPRARTGGARPAGDGPAR